MNRKLVWVAVAVAVIVGAWWFVFRGSVPQALDTKTKQTPEQPIQLTREADGVLVEGDLAYEAGVNPEMIDQPKMQVAWMKRGHGITLKKFPEADAANFRDSYFHRGFKNTAVTCGEVEFLSEGEVIVPFQRFIFTGLQNSYFERDVQNFEVFWDKMCVEGFE